MIVQMTTPTGQHLVVDENIYQTSDNNLIAYLILLPCRKKLAPGESPLVSDQLLVVNFDKHPVLENKY